MSDDKNAAAKQPQSKKVPRTVSRAPAPPPRIEPSGWSPKKDPTVNIDRSALTPEQEAALKKLIDGEGEPLTIAKVLRPIAELVETWPLRDTEFARTVFGLVRISNPDVFAMVESGRVQLDQAALVGHYVRRVFVGHHPPQVCADFEMRAITRLAEGKPVSAGHFANPIEEVANDTQRTTHCAPPC